MKAKATELFNDAAKNLNFASTELLRPEEDVVTFAVCKHAQIAIENYLRGYLYTHGVDPGNLKTINDLYRECEKINENFKHIDLSEFNCKVREVDEGYCNDISTVSHCYTIADNLDTFLRKEKVIS